MINLIVFKINIQYYIYICDIFVFINRKDFLIKRIESQTEYLVAYIIKFYKDNNLAKSERSFNKYFKNNFIGISFNLQNFWNKMDRDMAQVIISKSYEILDFLNTESFEKMELPDQLIIYTYYDEFNLKK